MKTKITLVRAMSLSLIMIVAAVAMLFTTSYSWFMDSKTEENNAIAAGTLNVALTATDKTGNAIDLTTEKIINESNWQPSDWNAVAVTVTNTGSLDIKFNLGLTIKSVAPLTDLSPVIWYTLTEVAAPTEANPYLRIAEPAAPVFMNNFTGVTSVNLAAGESITYRLDYGFLEEAGNEYQNGRLLADVTVQAYQTMA
jgi:hypothetical protein